MSAKYHPVSTLVVSVLWLLGTAAVSLAQDEAREREVEVFEREFSELDREVDMDGDRNPDRQPRLELKFVIPAGADEDEVVERFVQELRQQLDARNRRAEEESRFRRRPRRQARPGAPASRDNHLAEAIEHLQAAGRHDLAREVRARIQGGPDHRGDERVEHLMNMVRELQHVLHGVQERLQHSEAVNHAIEQAHRGLDELRHHVDRHLPRLEEAIDQAVARAEQHTDRRLAELQQHLERHLPQLEQAIEEVMVRTERQAEELERWMGEHMEQLELHLNERLEGAEEFLGDMESVLDEHLEDHHEEDHEDDHDEEEDDEDEDEDDDEDD